MSVFGRLRTWTRAVLYRRELEREMREEMAAHIVRAAERFERRGMSREDADAAARREFGQLAGAEEHARDVRGGASLHGLGGDVKYALRYFARTPLATVTIVLTLAVGIGFSSAIYSVIDGIGHSPAPLVPNDPSLVKIRGFSNPPLDDRLFSYEELAAYAALTGEFSAVAGWTTTDVIVDDGRADVSADKTLAHVVTPNYFRALGIAPASGRFFAQTQFGDVLVPELTAVVSYSMATVRLGGVAEAVGKRLNINDVSFIVVGVAPPKFRGARPGQAVPALWLPVSSLQALSGARTSPLANPDAILFEGFGRLQPGIRIEDALNSVRLIAASADRSAVARSPRDWTGSTDLIRLRGLMHPAVTAKDNMYGAMLLFGTLGLMVLITCTTTVSSLLVGAAVARRHEIGVRLALGASRARIVRQLLTETTLLSVAGATLGLGTYTVLCRLVESVRAGFDVTPRWTTVGLTILYALLAATLCGLSPALHATRRGLSEVLKDSAGGATTRSRLQRTFVVAQIALSMPLLVALAALISEVSLNLPPSRDEVPRERVLVAKYATETGQHATGPDRIPGLVRAIAKLPGVQAVLPVSDGAHFMVVERPTPTLASDTLREHRSSYVMIRDVPPGYFDALGIRLVGGRDFVASDTTLSATPIVLDETTATEWFGTGNPVGQRIFERVQRGERPTELEIIGIARTEREDKTATAFAPFKRRREGTVLIRTAGPAEPLIPSVLAVTRAEARTLPLTHLQTLAGDDRQKRRRVMQVVGGGAGAGSIALLLAAIGLYALVSISVGQRLREIGVRMALGARPHRLVVSFFLDGVWTSALGVAIGVPLSIAGVEVLIAANTMGGRNPMNLIGVVAPIVAGVAALATWIPARRAAGVDPMVALRAE